MSNLFSWSGINRQGQVVYGRSYAESKTELKYEFYQQEIFIKKIEKPNHHCLILRRWLNNKQTLFFLTQIQALLLAGLNLSKTIDILQQNQTHRQLSELLCCLKHQLTSGEKVSDVLKLYPTLFDNIILQFIKSGEATGQIDKAMQQAFVYYDQKQKTLNQLLTALLYPVVLLLVSMTVLITLAVFVIPQFESMYSQSKAQLPLITAAILTISDWISLNFSNLCIATFFILVLLLLLRRIKQFQWTDYVPFFNRTIKKVNTLRFCQTTSALYAAGLSITDCIESCRSLSSDHRYQQAIDRTLTEIKNGHSFAYGLTKSQYFDSLLIQLIKTGEESASLAIMLEQCCNYYRDQLNNNFERLKIILEPVLILALGAIIGLILIAMYLPVFNLGSNF